MFVCVRVHACVCVFVCADNKDITQPLMTGRGDYTGTTAPVVVVQQGDHISATTHHAPKHAHQGTTSKRAAILGLLGLLVMTSATLLVRLEDNVRAALPADACALPKTTPNYQKR